MKTATSNAAGMADARAEELMEAVMQEALFIFRKELYVEIEKLDATTQQLTFKVDAHESHWEEITALAEDVKQHIEVLRSPKFSEVVEQVQANQAEHKQILRTIDKLTGHCNEQLEQVRSDLRSAAVCYEEFAVATHNNLSRIQEQMHTANPGTHDIFCQRLAKDMQDVQPTCETGKYPDDRVSDLNAELSRVGIECTSFASSHEEQICKVHEQLSKIADDPTSAQLSEIMRQMRAICTSFVEGTREAVLLELQKHMVATKRCVDKKIADGLAELQQHRAAINDHVDERISELQLTLSQIQGEQEVRQFSKINEESMADQLVELRGFVEEMQRQLSEHTARPRHGDGLKAIMECANEQFSQMKKDRQDVRTHLPDNKIVSEVVTGSDMEVVTEATKDDVDENNSELQVNLCHIQLISEVPALPDLQRHKAAIEEHADRQVSAMQGSLSEIAADILNDEDLGQVPVEHFDRQISTTRSLLSEMVDGHLNDQILEEGNADSPERLLRLRCL